MTGDGTWSIARDGIAWVFSALLLATGVANLILVDAVPATGYALLSLVYMPPVNVAIRRRLGMSVHPLLKIALGIGIVMFTLGVSDLGDMLD